MEYQEPESRYQSVMLIDDNKIDNFISRMTLEDARFAGNIVAYTSAEKALEFLCNNLTTTPGPDFIFLDINMPVMNGFRFLEELEKLNPNLREATKIVMLSTSNDKADIDKALQYKSVYKYLIKPLSEEALMLL